MIEYLHSHQAQFWIAFGFLLLALEVLLLGFSTIILFFAGLGALATGLFMLAGILPTSWIAGVAGFGISTGLLGVLLWKPLRQLQDRTPAKRQPTSDLIGYRFVLDQDISATQPGKHRYSGVEWKVELANGSDLPELKAGDQVLVDSVDVGIFRVKAVD